MRGSIPIRVRDKRRFPSAAGELFAPRRGPDSDAGIFVPTSAASGGVDKPGIARDDFVERRLVPMFEPVGKQFGIAGVVIPHF